MSYSVFDTSMNSYAVTICFLQRDTTIFSDTIAYVEESNRHMSGRLYDMSGTTIIPADPSVPIFCEVVVQQSEPFFPG